MSIKDLKIEAEVCGEQPSPPKSVYLQEEKHSLD
jgi:hypothetical protein